MDVSRIAAGKIELQRDPIDLAVLLGTTADELMPGAIAKGIRPDVHVEPCSLVVGDRERLHQVFSNLLANALKFTPSGGRVVLSCAQDGGQVVVTVADTGEGIPAEFVPRLFERFTQADSSSTRRYGGLGLGLAIVRHLVELHGGSVSAQSGGRGQGATFFVHLPAVGLQADAARVRPRRTPSSPAARLDGVEVLLVEDDRVALEAMTLLLEQSGAHVSAATSVSEAWSAFTDRSPDVVVSDLSMPDEDGYSLLRRIQQVRTSRRVPAVAMTGLVRPEDRAQVLSAGFSAHVPKPIDPDQLVRVLVEVLEEERARS
ncbi:MAG: ATP-binding protein [Thermodesulfobacteriota bacterium]